MDSILDQLSLGTLSDNFVNERIDPGVALSMSDSALADLGVNTIGDREGPPGVFGEQGNTGNLAMGTREQSKKIVGNKGTSNRLGNRGTNTKNYKALRFLHKRGGDRRFSAVF